MTQKEIDEIIRKHSEWLINSNNGARADLSNANLNNADLSNANLKEANLEKANLKWVNLEKANLEGADFEGANLERANFRGADLGGANLKGANLKEANLKGADLDFAALPLWCGSLDVHFDDKQIIQQLYHVVRNALFSKNTSERVKQALLPLIDLANEFHRVDECGKIMKPEESEKE